MLFFELEFLLFFTLFFLVYLMMGRVRQNKLIIAASYFFYGLWDYRFLGLLIVSTLVDFFVSNKIEECNNKKGKSKFFLLVSIVTNIGILATFKYFNFFAESFVNLTTSIGWSLSPFTLEVILPAGISFYTFQTLSYTIDVYNRKITAEKNFINFSAYVAFFPQLVAGPIERAGNLLIQFHKSRVVTASCFFVGIRLFGWGVFKKLFIADNLANIADPVFANPSSYDSLSLLIALYAFSFQIYCDFSGYSDMARGLAKMMGFELSINFNLPYFSKSLREFWTRWHITLSNWIRDYIYFPLGGSRGSKLFTSKNLIIAMLLSGLWHGAGWNFIFWGAYNGVIMASEYILKDSWLTSWWRQRSATLRVIVTFHIVCFGWLLFRVNSVGEVYTYLYSFISGLERYTTELVLDNHDWLTLIDRVFELYIGDSIGYIIKLLFYITPLLMVQIFQYSKSDHLFELSWKSWAKGSVYAVLFFSLLTFGASDGKQFIYFQF
ncbi:MBOAT family O-acyltransferase [Vibrio bivalvicida]|uniref:Probable alginate O-acetylase n=1 Tax=Vibrio bivalvicida TaxID=1276888 RepID=A0A177Y5L1_9VIBR|nr:MBOAT family O-acyltransferase [Vibrio bivalvicida]OAJ96153.1 hypothetical protein APB76_01210 [Vibrio bivalvicida]